MLEDLRLSPSTGRLRSSLRSTLHPSRIVGAPLLGGLGSCIGVDPLLCGVCGALTGDALDITVTRGVPRADTDEVSHDRPTAFSRMPRRPLLEHSSLLGVCTDDDTGYGPPHPDSSCFGAWSGLTMNGSDW